jgi:hypothetical protein
MNEYTFETTTEIPFKQWKIEQSEKLGISVECLNNRLYGQKGQRTRVPMPKLRRVNQRVMFAIVPAIQPLDYSI